MLFQITAPLHRYTQAFSDIDTGTLSTQRLCELARIEKEVQGNIILHLGTSFVLVCLCHPTLNPLWPKAIVLQE